MKKKKVKWVFGGGGKKKNSLDFFFPKKNVLRSIKCNSLNVKIKLMVGLRKKVRRADVYNLKE